MKASKPGVQALFLVDTPLVRHALPSRRAWLSSSPSVERGVAAIDYIGWRTVTEEACSIPFPYWIVTAGRREGGPITKVFS